MNPDDRSEGLLAWQRAGYHRYHADRRNLLLHAVTVPLFLGGALSLPAALALRGPLALGSVAAMLTALLAQGRGHRREHNPPAPFRGRLDVAARLFAEQFVTFPRFVLSGDFARAWRGETGTTG